MKKAHLMFAVCEKYHNSRTIPLYNTVCEEAKKYNHDISLIGGFTNTIDNIPVLKLVNDDTYESAIDKNLKAILHHYERNTQFDFYMICDDDTFINFTKLNDLLESIDNNTLALYGCVGPICSDGRPHVTGGPGILMNRRTFNVIAETVSKYYIRHHIFSDVSVALNVHKYNDSCDSTQEKIKFINIEQFLNPHKILTSMKKVITYHISGRNSYIDLQHELLS